MIFSKTVDFFKAVVLSLIVEAESFMMWTFLELILTSKALELIESSLS